MTQPDTPTSLPHGPQGALAWAISALATATTLMALAWAVDLFRAAGLNIYNEQYVAAMLGLALATVFLARPARGAVRTRLPWYDLLAALIGAGACGYVAVRYPSLLDRLWMRPTDALIVGGVILTLVLEGLRRATGWAMVILVLVALGFGLLGHFIPGSLQGRNVATDRLVIFLALDTGAVLGMPLMIASTVVVVYVFFGNLLNRSGGGTFFTDLAMAMMGRYRGGAAKVAVTASALFGSVSGSAVANVVSTGVITIPLMKRGGYKPHHAGAIEAVASTGGQLMPPVMGAAAFLMAEIIQVPYASIAAAALLPALLYYGALLIQVDLMAARDGLSGAPRELLPRLGRVLANGWPFALPFVVLIYALFVLNERPEYAAFLASLSVIAVGLWFEWRKRRATDPDASGFRLRMVLDTLRETGLSVTDILMIGAAAGIIIGVMNISSLGFALTLVLVQLGQGNLALLLLIAALTCIVLGMGMPTLGVYLLLATLIAPSLVEVGVEPIAAHLFVLYFGMMSMITPPVAIAAFAAASISGARTMRTGYAAMVMGWSAYLIPFLFVGAPALLLIGTPLSIAWTFATALLGVWFVSASVVGYLFTAANPMQRVLLGLGGLLLFLPAQVGGLWSDFVGLGLGLAAMLWMQRAPQTAKI
ncbi:TRAP transporter permease [Pararhodobacter zhoushanensis]|uniref:TRAP transporter permease n=1 Tax=Pararhodobacter zhoushanensis TaxID=2479545 RepID=UPI000F8C89EC|nr:TRAP transporter fused permease subunit [Pararhodobacter zhoushanensis]